MANQALAALESALRAKKLDRTLTTALPPLERSDVAALAPTGAATLDACLRGGLPRGQLSEIAGPRSSGRTTLLLALLAAATQRGEIAALVDTFDRLDLTSVMNAEADLDRLLWIRGQAISASAEATADKSKTEGAIHGHHFSRSVRVRSSPSDPRPALPDPRSRILEPWSPISVPGANLLERAIDRALKAFNLVLQAGGFGVVALDLADVPAVALQRLPFTTWLRVQRAVEGSDSGCGTTITLAPSLGGGMRWAGDSDRSRRLEGLDIGARIISPRRRVEGDVVVRCGVGRAEARRYDGEYVCS